MTQGEKVKEIRKTLGLTLDQFGEKIGIKKSALSKIENGLNSLSDTLSISICREFKVNPDYLTGTSEEMFLEMSKEDEIAAFLGDVLRDKDETFKKRFVAALARLTDEDWTVMEKLIDRLTK